MSRCGVVEESIACATRPISQAAPSLTQVAICFSTSLPTPFSAPLTGEVMAPIALPVTALQASPTGLPPPIAPPTIPTPPAITPAARAGGVADDVRLSLLGRGASEQEQRCEQPPPGRRERGTYGARS